MVARGPGDVGCAHCRMIGATVSCRICGHLVCERCEGNWTTCEEPATIAMTLGKSRLRDVDPAGRYGAVSHRGGTSRLLDLRRVAWVDLPELPLFAPNRRSSVLGDGSYFHPRWLFDDAGYPLFAGFTVTTLGGQSRQFSPEVAEHPKESYRLDGALAWCVTSAETIGVFDLDTGRWTTFAPMHGKVLQAASLDARDRTLAVASWGTLMLFRLDGDQPTPLLRGPVPGDVAWIGVRGDTLVACADGGRTVIAWHLSADRTIARERMRFAYGLGERVAHADLSRDGRYLAIALGRRLVLHDLETQTKHDLAEHADDIELVRFGGDLLIVSDEAGHVFVRQRTGGYEARVVEVPLATAPVPYQPPTS